MVFDGLETMFARSTVSALFCLLKAINNRRYIYFVNLFQDFAAMKAREISKQEQEGKNNVVFVGFFCVLFPVTFDRIRQWNLWLSDLSSFFLNCFFFLQEL